MISILFRTPPEIDIKITENKINLDQCWSFSILRGLARVKLGLVT